MKKIVLAIVLTFASNVALAEWVQYAKEDGVTLYYNNESIQTKGNRAKVQVINDYLTPQVKHITYKSTQHQEIFDCYTKQFTITYLEFFAENLGFGKRVELLNVIDVPWRAVSPDSPAGNLFDIICK